MAIPLEKLIHSNLDQVNILNKIFSKVDIHLAWSKFLSKNRHFAFFYKVIIRTIDACMAGTYTEFDAHTTSNCCHGMSLLARLLILSTQSLNLKTIQKETAKKLDALEQNVLEAQPASIDWLPWQIIALSSLFVLAFVGEIDPQRGRRTKPQKLKSISPIGTNFTGKLIRSLQKKFSNLVANSYNLCSQEVNGSNFVSGAPINLWSKYIQSDYLRTDKRGVQYAPCLFSMQITLAHLIYSHSKIAIVNDLMSTEGEIKGRYIRFLEGDGQNQFRLMAPEEIALIEPYDRFEPVVVFGGCAVSDDLEMDSLALAMNKWLNQLPSLILACDAHYPQFPTVMDDPDFDSTPIIPEEESLKNIIKECYPIRGVSSQDPSLFCLAHIYPSSIGQIFEVWKEDSSLPYSSIYMPKQILPSKLAKKMAGCS